MTADGNSSTASEVYRAVRFDLDSAFLLQKKRIGWHRAVQINTRPKHTTIAARGILKAKKWDIFTGRADHPNPLDRAFQLLMAKLKAEL